jgi:hypothetical protein
MIGKVWFPASGVAGRVHQEGSAGLPKRFRQALKTDAVYLRNASCKFTPGAQIAAEERKGISTASSGPRSLPWTGSPQLKLYM